MTAPNLIELQYLRRSLTTSFSPETAYPGSPAHPPSSGHCAVVAIIIWMMYGGDLVSTTVKGVSHWFNRVGGFDIDLTGDQFGLAQLQITLEGELYPTSQVRSQQDISADTWRRAVKLAINLGRTK